MDLSRLAKVWALTTSSNQGEAAAARNRARAIVEREGRTLADVPGLLRDWMWPRAREAESPASREPEPLHFTEEELRRLHEQRTAPRMPRWQRRLIVWFLPSLYALAGIVGICRVVWRLL